MIKESWPYLEYSISRVSKLQTYKLYIDSLDNFILEIHDFTTWEYVKTRINMYLGHYDYCCCVCLETPKYVIGCPRCHNFLCIECVNEIIKRGEGIRLCPMCRYSSGSKMSKSAIDLICDLMSEKYPTSSL